MQHAHKILLQRVNEKFPELEELTMTMIDDGRDQRISYFFIFFLYSFRSIKRFLNMYDVCQILVICRRTEDLLLQSRDRTVQLDHPHGVTGVWRVWFENLELKMGCSHEPFQQFKYDQLCIALFNRGVSKNRGGPPKWMVYNGKPY